MTRAAGLVLALAACSGKTKDTPARGSAGAAVVRDATAVADAIEVDVPETFALDAPTIELVKPGANPHAIRYAPTAGERTAKIEFSTGPIGQDVLGIDLTLAWKRPAAATQPFEFRVTESTPIKPPDAKGGEAAVMNAVGGMYSAVGGRVDADAQGRARLTRTTTTLPTNPSLLWLLHPLFVPLPEQPIGVGAVWTVKQELALEQSIGALERRYELTAARGDALSIKVTGHTTWNAPGGSADTAVTETTSGTLAVTPTDMLAQSANIQIVQDLGVLKSATMLKLH